MEWLHESPGAALGDPDEGPHRGFASLRSVGGGLESPVGGYHGGARSPHLQTREHGQEEPIDVDAEMDVQEQKVMDAAEEEAKRTVKAQRQREEADTKAQALLTTLQNLQSEAKRDGSRTPRRCTSNDRQGQTAVGSNSADGQPERPGEGQPASKTAPPPGEARV